MKSRFSYHFVTRSSGRESAPSNLPKYQSLLTTVKRGKRSAATLMVAALLAFSSPAADEVLQIQKWADSTKPIPISVSGFNGEADTTLRFDLEVMGCKIVSANDAVYAVSGNNNGNLTGFLHWVSTKTQMLGKSYNGGTPRSQAHAFADD